MTHTVKKIVQFLLEVVDEVLETVRIEEEPPIDDKTQLIET